MNRESLYLRLPTVLQDVACSIEGWRVRYSRFGGRFHHLLHSAIERGTWTQEQIRMYQDEQVQTFIQHCYNTVPFYRQQFEQLGVSVHDIQTLDSLSVLPILTKSLVQDHYPDLVSTSVPKQQQIVAHTSGTTGGGLRFATTLNAIQEQWAIWWRYRRWHGLPMDTWCGYFGGRSVVPLTQTCPPFWRYNYPGRQILFSAYHMNHDNLAFYIQELRRRQPLWLHGYPSLLALLASHVVEEGTDLGYQVQWITIGAENLLPQHVELMQKAFGVRPKQHYGMAEAVANFSECEHGRLHVDEDFAAVEFMPNPNGPGYKVIGTNFTNPATPLVRYDVQDLVMLSEGNCPCGRPGRIVERIDGRAEDYVILKNGAQLGRMDHIFKDMVNIREAQIYQRKPGEIFLRVVRSEHYAEADETALLRETKKRVGADTDIHIDYVARIERSATGKLRFVVSDIPKARLEHMSQ